MNAYISIPLKMLSIKSHETRCTVLYMNDGYVTLWENPYFGTNVIAVFYSMPMWGCSHRGVIYFHHSYLFFTTSFFGSLLYCFFKMDVYNHFNLYISRCGNWVKLTCLQVKVALCGIWQLQAEIAWLRPTNELSWWFLLASECKRTVRRWEVTWWGLHDIIVEKNSQIQVFFQCIISLFMLMLNLKHLWFQKNCMD